MEQPQPEPEFKEQEQTLPEPISEPKKKVSRSPGIIIAVILLVGLLGGGSIGYGLSYVTFNGEITNLQRQIQDLPPANATYVSYPNTSYVLYGNVSLADLYNKVQMSVVVVRGILVQRDFFGRQIYSAVQGSGFITEVNGQTVAVTNNHVVRNTINNTITFTDGIGYAATLLGSDEYSDLAVLAIESQSNDLSPLEIVDSTSLKVGDPVIAVGSPYGLEGSVTTGIVSALGRTITEDLSGGVTIPNIIQTSTPINSGNSGGPLVNYAGQVVGITTAIVSNSQGLGFAIPSNTILREIEALVTNGSYTEHSTISASGRDMTYEIAQNMNTSTTSGWLVENAAATTGLRTGTTKTLIAATTVTIGGDIILAVNGEKITNGDDLWSYLEANTLPGQIADITVLRDGELRTVAVSIEKLT